MSTMHILQTLVLEPSLQVSEGIWAPWGRGWSRAEHREGELEPGAQRSTDTGLVPLSPAGSQEASVEQIKSQQSQATSYRTRGESVGYPQQ